jgi:C4-dicarboxylate-specific signal transduction histidine kinase
MSASPTSRHSDEALHRDRMATVGQLAAGIAHEINTPLAFIRSNLGTITLTTRAAQDRVLVAIADTGRGIASEHWRSCLHRSFHSASQALARDWTC